MKKMVLGQFLGHKCPSTFADDLKHIEMKYENIITMGDCD